MSRKPVPDLLRIANDLELLSARVDAVCSDVRHLAEDVAELTAKTAAFAEATREYLANVREANVKGMR